MTTRTGIKEAIRQRRPFHSPEAETFLTLMRTADRLSERVSAPLREVGLTAPQYNVLRILRGAEPEGLRTYQVADRMVARAPNITRLVDHLEGKRLLSRKRSRSDRRVITLRISRTGTDLLARLDRPVNQAVKQAMRGLSGEQQRSLRTLLDGLRGPLEERPGSAEKSREPP